MIPANPSTSAPVTCCDEFARMTTLSRRSLLRSAAVVGGLTAGLTTASTIGDAFLQTSYAATRSAPAVMVVLSLRGGADGMSLVVPHGDPVYYEARPTIGIPAERLIAKDAFFGLHPNLAPLLPLWQGGRMASVHAAGLPVPNRSHFDAIEEIEDADPGTSARIGWLNRLIGRDDYTSPLQAIQYGDTVPPTALLGPQSVVATYDIGSVRLAGADDEDGAARRSRSLRTLWAPARGPLAAGVRASLEAIEDYRAVQASSDVPANGATYPEGGLGAALAATARTIRADVGAEVFTIDYGSWDHHTDVGTLDSGEMQGMATELAAALAAFFTDLGELGDKVTLVTVSEFGRRLRENDQQGLDHGFGTAMLVLGAGVRGGYHGRWPGLELPEDDDSDLVVTTDYRSVLSEIVSRRLGASTAAVFPGFTPEDVGVISSL